VGKVGTWYWYFGKHNTYHTTSVQVFSSVIPTIPTIPRYFEISIPTIPARSGIFRCHTCDTRNTPVFWYLPYQLDQVFSNAIPTIPTRTVVWDTPGIYRGNPGKYPTRCTTNWRQTTGSYQSRWRAVFKMYQTSRRFFTPVNTQHDALNKVSRAVGGCVTIASNIYDHRLWWRGWGWSWVCGGIWICTGWLRPGHRSARRSWCCRSCVPRGYISTSATVGTHDRGLRVVLWGLRVVLGGLCGCDGVGGEVGGWVSGATTCTRSETLACTAGWQFRNRS